MRNSETKRGCGSAEVISTRNKEGCRTDSEEHVPAQCAPPSRALATHGAPPCDSRPALVFPLACLQPRRGRDGGSLVQGPSY